MSFKLDAVSSQNRRIAVVTGANTGLGFETASALASKGMTVIMACRNADKAEQARRTILKQWPDAELVVLPLDLSRLASVREFADVFLARYGQLDRLINNAGVMMPPFSLTEDGFELQMGVNYFSHFLLTGLLLDRLEATPGARVVTLSSMAHRSGKINFDDLNSERHYSRIEAYAQSKLACLMFALELQRRLSAGGYQAISVAAHPGISDTELSRHLPGWLMKTLGPVLMPMFSQSPRAGAEPTLYAALGDDIEGGDYTGPSGFREMKGRAVKVGTRRLARNPRVAARLWRESERQTGLAWLSDL